MKQFLFTILFLSFITTKAQILEVTKIEELTTEGIQAVLTAFGVPQGFIENRFDVDLYRVRYTSTNPSNGEPIEASGAIAVPIGTQCPLPLVSYQHGTVALKTDVPSFNNFEANIGKVFASSGYVVCMPDYIGLGTSPGLHPYVHAKSEADAALDLMRAARELSDSLQFTLNDQLFIFGYSQGGHATMALHKEIQENFSNEFTVTASCPMSGPYDLSGVQAEVLTSSNAYPTPGYLPYVVLSYQSVYGNIFNDPSEVFVSPYDELIPPLFDGTNSMGYINDQVPNIPSTMVNPELLNDFITNPLNPLRIALADNDNYDWLPTAPIRMLYCEGDDQVSYLNSEKAYDTFIANGAENIEKVDFGIFTHSGCVQFCLLNGYNYFKSFRDEANGLIVSTEVQPETGIGLSNGSINVTIQGGEEPYQVSWSGGLEGTEIVNIPANEYLLTVTDARECRVKDLISLPLVQSVHETNALNFRFFPNPAKHELIINASEKGTVTLRDLQGAEIMSKNVLRDEVNVFQIAELASGMYFLHFISNSSQSKSLKFIKE
jgi:hypothetical protein